MKQTECLKCGKIIKGKTEAQLIGRFDMHLSEHKQPNVKKNVKKC